MGELRHRAHRSLVPLTISAKTKSSNQNSSKSACGIGGDPVEPSPFDVSPIGEGPADGEPKANPEWGGDRLNLPLLGDKVAGPGVGPWVKPTRQGPQDPRKNFNLGFGNGDFAEIFVRQERRTKVQK